MQLKQGTLLQGGKYRIEEFLGQGGFGITYIATDTRLDRQICVKEFFMKGYCSRATDTSFVTVASEDARQQIDLYREKFMKEARLISSMNNPYIITIFDVFEGNGTAYYTMEYLGGGSLKTLIEQNGVLSEHSALKYISEIAGALSYLHKQKVMHLDVKPSNIMLDSRGRAVLIDFGISKRYDHDGGQTSSTPVGISEGYAPMEQYNQNGVSTFSPETDIYSLGATLYFLLTGQSPKEANVINENGLGELPKHISRKVRQVITHAMQPKRKDRFSNADDFLKELSITYHQDTGKEKKDWRLIAVVAASIVCVVIGWICYAGLSASEDTNAEESKVIPQEITSQTFTVNGVSFDMMKVEGGSFTMGATDEMENPNDNEKTTHVDSLSTYYIGRTEVTQTLWTAVMDSNPSKFRGDGMPVENVSWNDCQHFISKLNELTGKNFRLPTEAEWEFAARGGRNSNHTQYSGSGTLDEVGWYKAISRNRANPVATKKANELGIYDMTGNVSEWCQDWYGDYSNTPQTNPTGPTRGFDRVHRGGSWDSPAENCRTSRRFFSLPTNRGNFVGFRLALSL